MFDDRHRLCDPPLPGSNYGRRPVMATPVSLEPIGIPRGIPLWDTVHHPSPVTCHASPRHGFPESSVLGFPRDVVTFVTRHGLLVTAFL